MAKKTSKEIEDRYVDEDQSVTQERSDFLLPQVIDFVTRRQWMNLQPEYQRRQVWDRAKQSRFLESLLMNLPVPPVFLFEPEYNRYEVMDGQQRLSSIVSFYEGKLKLTGLEHWTELNGKFYSDLPLKLQRGLDRRRISAVVLQTSSDADRAEELRRVVFERLNTGGQKLNAQELRNCLYSSDFAGLLVELAGYSTFNDMFDIPRYEDNVVDGRPSTALAQNTLYKRMTDCELVLRFFAFRDRRNVKGSVKAMLDRSMKINRDVGPDQLAQMSADFKSRVDMAEQLFGPDAFKLLDEAGENYVVSHPYYDAVMVACDKHFKSKSKLIRRARALERSIEAELARPEIYGLMVGRANTASSMRERFKVMEDCFEAAIK